jgi:hypothetical protein
MRLARARTALPPATVRTLAANRNSPLSPLLRGERVRVRGSRLLRSLLQPLTPLSP